MLSRDRKVEQKAPCLYESFDEVKQRDITTAPAVNCDFVCEACPWNPAEAQRRLEEGAWVYSPNGIRHLLFRRKVVNAEG